MFNLRCAKSWALLTGFVGATAIVCNSKAYGQNPVEIIAQHGNNQTGSPGSFAPQPLILAVQDRSGGRLARVKIKVEATEGQIQASSISAPGHTLVLETDANGEATIFYRLPDIPDKYNLVIASLAEGDRSQGMSFMINSDDGTHKYLSPFESTIHSQFNPDGSGTFAWTNYLAGAKGFRVLRSDDKGRTWKVVGETPREMKSYTVPAGMSMGVIGYSLFKVEPIVEGPEAQLIAANTPSPIDDAVLVRERKFKERQQRRGLATPTIPVTQ